MPPSPQRPAIVRASTGSGFYALAFGAVAVAAGLSRGQAQALSLVMFSGASQSRSTDSCPPAGDAGTCEGVDHRRVPQATASTVAR